MPFKVFYHLYSTRKERHNYPIRVTRIRALLPGPMSLFILLPSLKSIRAFSASSVLCYTVSQMCGVTWVLQLWGDVSHGCYSCEVMCHMSVTAVRWCVTWVSHCQRCVPLCHVWAACVLLNTSESVFVSFFSNHSTFWSISDSNYFT